MKKLTLSWIAKWNGATESISHLESSKKKTKGFLESINMLKDKGLLEDDNRSSNYIMHPPCLWSLNSERRRSQWEREREEQVRERR